MRAAHCVLLFIISKNFELQIFANCEVFFYGVEIGIDLFIIKANNVDFCIMTFDYEKSFCLAVVIIIFSLSCAFIC